MFKRQIISQLEYWSQKKERKPLVLRGARQVGKTTVIEIFSQNFDNCIMLNLDNPGDKNLFEADRSFSEILNAIFFNKGVEKNKGRVLIFIDEIQNSAKAINLLRYFYEESPELFVIAAGSLLETLINRQISFPVGRVEYLGVFPCTFHEFLTAIQDNAALQILDQIPVPEFAHEKLMKHFHQFTLIGGMPEIVSSFSKNQDITSLSGIYESLLLTYLDDVEKYARNDTMTRVIRHVIKSSFDFPSARIKFAGFGNSQYKSREVSEAFAVLQKAMLLQLIYPATNLQHPVRENFKKSPRLQLLDTGMVNFFADMQKMVFNASQIDDVYGGKIAEHIVGQELRVVNNSLLRNVMFWTREEKHADAEIDFIWKYEDMIIPIEVKSGKSGKLRSLHQFMDRVNHEFAVRISSGNLSVQKVETIHGKEFFLLNLPFYLTYQINVYLQEFTTNPEMFPAQK
jgi:predicted AAA+ superfamily ATPase